MNNINRNPGENNLENPTKHNKIHNCKKILKNGVTYHKNKHLQKKHTNDDSE